MKKPSTALFERMKKDAGRGLSDKPGDNYLIRGLPDDWLNVLTEADNNNLQPLKWLLGIGRVPTSVMPFLADTLDRLETKLKRGHGRRRDALYAPPKKAMIFNLANKRVSELVRQGSSVNKALAVVARQWAPLGIEQKALADFRSGKSGNARRLKGRLV